MFTTELSSIQHPPTLPGPTSRNPLGMMRYIQADPLARLRQIADEYDGFARFRAGFWDICLVAHPDPIREILRDRRQSFSKKTFSYQMVKSVAGPGLLTFSDDEWLPRRRLMQPIFSKERIAKLDSLMTTATERRLDQWQRIANTGSCFDAGAAVNELTIEIAAKAFFDVDIEQSEALRAATETHSRAFASRLRSPLAAMWGMAGLPFLGNVQLRRARQVLNEATLQIIREMRQSNASSDKLVAQLARAVDDETGAVLNEQALQTEVMTLLIAGHETTARLLGWALYLLGRHSDVMSHLQREVKEQLQGRRPTAADVANLPYLNQVIDETLRLYPSVWTFNRRAESDESVCGYRIPQGARLLISPYLLHRQAAFWPNPDDFLPQRFAPNTKEAILPHTYIPFGAGPQQCIGKRFALLETQLVLAMIASRFTLHPTSEQAVEADAVATLSPKTAIQMTLQAL